MSEPIPVGVGAPKGGPSSAPIRNLELTVLRRLDGLLQGDYAGLLPGHGTEAGEARLYVPGDDTRRIDWALTARAQEPHVRDTIADHELELWLVVDASSSLAFGTARVQKAELAWSVAGALAILATRGGNRVGAVLASDDRRTIPARSGRAHVGALLAALRHPVDDGAGSDLAGALDAVRRNAHRRGMVAVISDFVVPDGWQRPLNALGRRHDLLAVEVVDPRELTLPDVGLVRLVDPETGRQRDLDTSKHSVREKYEQAAAAQRAAIAASLREAGADHLQLRTDRDWVMDLVAFVGRRKARRLAARGGRR